MIVVVCFLLVEGVIFEVSSGKWKSAKLEFSRFSHDMGVHHCAPRAPPVWGLHELSAVAGWRGCEEGDSAA